MSLKDSFSTDDSSKTSSSSNAPNRSNTPAQNLEQQDIISSRTDVQDVQNLIALASRVTLPPGASEVRISQLA